MRPRQAPLLCPRCSKAARVAVESAVATCTCRSCGLDEHHRFAEARVTSDERGWGRPASFAMRGGSNPASWAPQFCNDYM